MQVLILYKLFTLNYKGLCVFKCEKRTPDVLAHFHLLSKKIAPILLIFSIFSSLIMIASVDRPPTGSSAKWLLTQQVMQAKFCQLILTLGRLTYLVVTVHCPGGKSSSFQKENGCLSQLGANFCLSSPITQAADHYYTLGVVDMAKRNVIVI